MEGKQISCTDQQRMERLPSGRLIIENTHEPWTARSLTARSLSARSLSAKPRHEGSYCVEYSVDSD